MCYLEQFGIKYNPFVKNSKFIEYKSNDFKQLIIRLNHLIKNNGLGIITGEPGLGKTTAIRLWSDSLNTSSYNMLYIKLSTLSICEFYTQIASSLHLEEIGSKRKNFKNIQDEIKRLYIEKRITTVIIIDEANHLSTQILNDIKMLINFDMDSKDCMIMLFVGQNTLRSSLLAKSNEPLRQRISLNFNFSHYEYNEVKGYVLDRLEKSGLNTDKFISEQALELLANSCFGTPRIINQIMDKCLFFVENQKECCISENIMLNAIEETTI